MITDGVLSVYMSTVNGKPYSKAVGFRNRTEMADYYRDIENIKEKAAEIAWRSLDLDNWRDRNLVNEWHTMCVVAFRDRWGLHRLPKDIRIQVNACEEQFVGTDPTNFGEDYGTFQFTADDGH